ncbi:hypothetical protein Angca_006391, partial [Angiostrongylus cantonensis]
DLIGKKIDFPWLESTTYVLQIRVNPVNDPPELAEAKGTNLLKISAKGSRLLTSDNILLSDPDDGPDKVFVQVVEARGVHLRVGNATVTEFTQRQFINRLVSIQDEGLFDKGVLRLIARDRDARSQVLTLQTISTPVEIDRGLVRFRHTSAHHPTQDTFSFQVESGGFVSMIHNFRLMFIPMNVKVFNREVFMLNGTESGTLSRSNLFAWTFPKGYPPEKLIYHIEEPPKYGILSRKINGKSRRIGVSSNFTQAIIFVPTQTSIQLVNRTVVVQEGETSVVGSDSLSLATPDDSFFVFTLTFAPINGSLVLRTRTGNKTLTTGMNFTTKDIAEERLLYSHSGSESRTDQLHLIAESAFRKGRRIPFWMSFSIIPVNDNRPHLRGSHIIQIVERGERILYPHLLDWVDDDSDGVPLQFNFYQPIKDAAVLSTVSPYLPVTLFSEQDLRQGRVMLRHLGHKNNFTVSYTVSDQKHIVDGLLRIIASDPFVRLTESLLTYCCLPGDTPTLLVEAANLSVVTNLDVRLEDIVYHTESDSFIMEYQRSRKPTRTFTQKDINGGKIFYNVGTASREVLTVRVGNQSLKAEMQIVRRSLGASLELRRSSTLSLPVGGVVPIDSTHLEIGDAVSSADNLVYNVIKQPQEGELILEQENTSSTPRLSVQRFTQRDVDLARVQYVHGAGGSGRDAIHFNISSPHITKGPYTLYVEIYEHYVNVKSSLLHVVAGSSAVVSNSILNVTSSDREDYVVNVVEKPNYGWIVLDSWSISNISSIGPQLLRNEILRVSAERTPITNAHLDTEDPDTPSSAVFFLISRPSKGMVVNVNDPSTPIYNFSQKDIDDLSIIYIRHANASGSGGFSFLLSDGLHQLGPEWFSIESWRSSSPVLQANAKLLASPSASTTRPEEILYSVSKPPKYGKLVVDTQESDRFSQLDINDGVVSIGHVPLSTMSMSSYDVVVFSVEGHSRALIVRIKPLDLALENHTVIEYPQGKTYVVLNRTHLSAYSNGDRSTITYKITSGPENGTFYWVAGEKEAKHFTQKDIDEGKILYAQLNMNSYKDSFEFLLANTEKGVVRNRSEISVRPLVTAQPVIVETNSAVPLTASQLNASALQGSTPRFLITSTPKYGRISLDLLSNHSVHFFTFPDILRGRVYYQAFSTDNEVTENIELEVRADSVQPARLVLPITIIPNDGEVHEPTRRDESDTDETEETHVERPHFSRIRDQVLVIILLSLLTFTVFILVCRHRRKCKSSTPSSPAPQTPSPNTSLLEKPDLLGSTVFASIGKSDLPRQPMKTFERKVITPLSKRRHQPTLDYAGLAT